jgi:hypothetical protein
MVARQGPGARGHFTHRRPGLIACRLHIIGQGVTRGVRAALRVRHGGIEGEASAALWRGMFMTGALEEVVLAKR